MSFTEQVKYDEGHIPAGNPGATLIFGPWTSVADFEEFAFILSIGAMDPACVLSVLVQQAKDEFGFGGTAIAGVDEPSRSGANGDGNEIVSTHGRVSQLRINEGYQYVRVGVNTSGGTADYAVVTVRSGPGKRPQVNP